MIVDNNPELFLETAEDSAKQIFRASFGVMIALNDSGPERDRECLVSELRPAQHACVVVKISTTKSCSKRWARRRDQMGAGALYRRHFT